MTDLTQFLRDRYAEARKAEEGKRCVIPSPFDGHDIVFERHGAGSQLLVDGHPYPIEKYTEIATEPAPDQPTLDDLDAKLAAVDACATFLHDSEHGPDACATAVLAALARPHRAHPDFNAAWLDD
jgi:hypothetical protein